MEIRKYGHSCLLLEEQGQYLLIDPGDFSFRDPFGKAADIPELVAVLITHNHGDHADPDTLKMFRERSKDLKVYGNEDSRAALEKEGVVVEVFESGIQTIGLFKVEALSSPHNPNVLAPVPANTAYRINGIFIHPGDSLDPILYAWQGTQVLALPVTAPWASRADSARLAENMKPQIVVPIHDGYTIESFRVNNLNPYKRHLESLGIILQPLSSSAESLTL